MILMLAYGSRSMPRGAVDIANFLKQRGHDAAVVHLRGMLSSVNRIKATPDIVGISVYTSISGQLRELIDLVRKAWPDVKIVVGGPHICEDVLAVERDLVGLADWLVIGPGEHALQLIASGKIPRGTVTGSPVSSGDFLRLEWPNEKYSQLIARGAWPHAIGINRGCPFRCSFCNPSREQVLFRDPAEAVAYLRDLDRWLPAKMRYIQDDVFAVNKLWLEQFAHETSKPTGTSTPLRCFIHGHGFDEERLTLLRKCGVVHASLGCESADDDVLKLANKGCTLGDYQRIHAMFRNHGDIQLHCLWMLGLPGETHRSLNKTLAQMFLLGTLPPNCGFATPYPGTQFYRDADHHGRILDSDWSTWSPKRISFVPNGLTITDLQNANKTARRICRR